LSYRRNIINPVARQNPKDLGGVLPRFVADKN